MTSVNLAQSYLRKAGDRIEVLDLLLRKGAYSDVVREAQEIVELCLKAMLRFVGIEPPKHHDVGPLLLEHADKFASISGEDLKRIASVSRALRKERELAFYGDIDFIPTEEYTIDDANAAREGARFALEQAQRLIR